MEKSEQISVFFDYTISLLGTIYNYNYISHRDVNSITSLKIIFLKSKIDEKVKV